MNSKTELITVSIVIQKNIKIIVYQIFFFKLYYIQLVSILTKFVKNTKNGELF